jgi:hypothetical protein
MGADDLYAIVLKERPTPESDFIWRCPCGVTGRGMKSEIAHSEKTKHELSEMQTYVPSQKLHEIAEALGAAQEEKSELLSQLPPESAHVLSDNQIREIIHAAIDATFVEEFEVSVDDLNNPFGSVSRFQLHMLWNETWWKGFEDRLAKVIEDGR